MAWCAPICLCGPSDESAITAALGMLSFPDDSVSPSDLTWAWYQQSTVSVTGEDRGVQTLTAPQANAGEVLHARVTPLDSGWASFSGHLRTVWPGTIASSWRNGVCILNPVTSDATMISWYRPGGFVQWDRWTAGAWSNGGNISNAFDAAPLWLRLIRSGSSLLWSSSQDGVTWAGPVLLSASFFGGVLFPSAPTHGGHGVDISVGGPGPSPVGYADRYVLA